MVEFSGKKILLIAPKFFGYEKEIAAELMKLGAQVDFLPDRPFNSPLAKAATRLSRKLLLPYMDVFFKASLKQLGGKVYDAIFVIQGEGLSKRTLKHFKLLFPDSYLVLYMWDSMQNKRSLLGNLPLYDARFTFDKIDSLTLNMKFRPLFFTSGFARGSGVTYEYDLSFVGTAHSDRYKIISKIEASSPLNVRFYKYLFLQARWLFYIKKLFLRDFRRAKISDFNFYPLSAGEVQQIFSQSMAIVDIEHPRQTGLTMRTFETLGAGKKLITTNSAVSEYDFYSPQNIFIIDRKCVAEIPAKFFSTPYQPVSAETLEKYSLSHWLIEIFSASSRMAHPSAR